MAKYILLNGVTFKLNNHVQFYAFGEYHLFYYISVNIQMFSFVKYQHHFQMIIMNSLRILYMKCCFMCFL